MAENETQIDPHAEFRDDPEYMALVGKVRDSRLVMLGGSDFDALIGKIGSALTRLSTPPLREYADVRNTLRECGRILLHAENPNYGAGLTDREQMVEAQNRG